MNYITLLALMFICVAFCHFKVVKAIGITTNMTDDPAYASFLFVFIYAALKSCNIIHAFALAFLLAYLSRWLDILLSILDCFYERIRTKYSQTKQGLFNKQNKSI